MDILFRRKPKEADLSLVYRDWQKFMHMDRVAFAARFEPMFRRDRSAAKWRAGKTAKI
jgi:hypothetical protein